MTSYEELLDPEVLAIEKHFASLPSELDELREDGSAMLKQLLEAGMITPQEAKEQAEKFGYTL